MDFRKALKLNKIISYSALILLFFAILFLNFNVIKLVFLIAFLISFLLKVIVIYFYIRCPECGGRLHGRYFKVSDCCPHCGHELNPKS